MRDYRFEINTVTKNGEEKVRKALEESPIIIDFKLKLKEGDHLKAKLTVNDDIKLGQLRDLIKSCGYYSTYKKGGLFGGLFNSF